jgi:carboxylesterase type B
MTCRRFSETTPTKEQISRPCRNGAISPAEFAEQAHKEFEALADKFLQVYPTGSTDDQAAVSHFASFRDEYFGWDMRTWACLKTQIGHSHTYRYYFTGVPPGRAAARVGAFHAAEFAYVLENLPFHLF